MKLINTHNALYSWRVRLNCVLGNDFREIEKYLQSLLSSYFCGINFPTGVSYLHLMLLEGGISQWWDSRSQWALPCHSFRLGQLYRKFSNMNSPQNPGARTTSPTNSIVIHTFFCWLRAWQRVADWTFLGQWHWQTAVCCSHTDDPLSSQGSLHTLFSWL